MLGSLNPSPHDHQEQDPSATDLQYRQIIQPSPAIQMRQLLISCAELISHSDFSAAHRLISILSAHSSPYGDSTERLVHQFVRALSLRPNHSHATASAFILNTSFSRAFQRHSPPSSYACGITGTGHDLNILQRTGDRLLKFAHSLGLRFQFHPLLILNDDPTSVALYLPSALTLLPDEALAVNCVLYLHRLLKDDYRDLRLFLHKIKALNPKVVTIAEREANHNHLLFLQRFVEALDHYTAIFDSLEATLPPNSRERLAVEQIWFGREIVDIVAAEGDNRRERHERFESWEVILRSSGFANVPLSPFALSQAKLLLRLHYPSEGYQLQIFNNSFFLGWQNRSLFSISSWR
ncbi:hypothetical protein Patl1_03661 [Pistacia atlantica]|uniref:Uncharacterized protein n=1 Tax=Pistacia atlantica TaxID=434234 RepID=A0ACC1BUD8_9ROSI|nr:hypothetical protein Patl1_03661 [Pistacia atlantica]